MKLLVGVSGSIAAYRSPDLVKALVQAGHNTKIVLTEGAKNFVSSRVLSTFSNDEVLDPNPFSDSLGGTDHIATARWADIVLVYGASANFLARYAVGIADDMLNLQLLATTAPVYVAPAMNPTMWKHPSVQKNIETLQKRGVRFINPIHGVVACGESGIGHIASIEEIIAKISEVGGSASLWSGKKVLISAGPMKSNIDPVRYLQNTSSGSMGLELARAATKVGAEVEIILGPVEAQVRNQFQSFKHFSYNNSHEYGALVDQKFKECDVFISAAAVLDFEVLPLSEKISREKLISAASSELVLKIQPVPDIVARAAENKKSHQKVVAFAAESGTDDEVLKRATEKFQRKKVDALIANPVREGLGPLSAHNHVWLLSKDLTGVKTIDLGRALKSELADSIVRELERHLWSEPSLKSGSLEAF